MFLKEFNENEQNAFIALASDIIAVDGKIDRNEKILLSQYLQEMGRTNKAIDIMTAGAAVELLVKSSETVKRQVFIELVALSKCDGTLMVNEKEYLHNMAEKFELSQKKEKELTDCVTELLALYEKIGKIISDEV